MEIHFTFIRFEVWITVFQCYSIIKILHFRDKFLPTLISFCKLNLRFYEVHSVLSTSNFNNTLLHDCHWLKAYDNMFLHDYLCQVLDITVWHKKKKSCSTVLETDCKTQENGYGRTAQEIFVFTRENGLTVTDFRYYFFSTVINIRLAAGKTHTHHLNGAVTSLWRSA